MRIKIKANDIGLLYQVLGCLQRSGDKSEATALNALLERLEDEQRAEREKNRRRAEQKK